MDLTPEDKALLTPQKAGRKSMRYLSAEEKARQQQKGRSTVALSFRARTEIAAMLKAQAAHQGKSENMMIQEMILIYTRMNPIPDTEPLSE